MADNITVNLAKTEIILFKIISKNCNADRKIKGAL